MSRALVPRLAVWLYFLGLFGLGLAIYRDYGISWDEAHQRFTGAVTARHLADRFAPSLVTGEIARLPKLEHYDDRDYGTAFELPAAALEKLLNLQDKRDVYMFRHLLTFLVCLTGVAALYRLALDRFGDWRLGLLAATFLVLSPRLFAESFYNSKDAVFMAVFTVATATAVPFLLRPGPGTALAFAAATAFAIDVRLMGVILPAAVTTGLAVRLLRRELPVARTVASLALCLTSMATFTVAGWVWLWANPIGNLGEAFANMARFRWVGHTLFLGDQVPGAALPWHYVLTWMSVTTPLLYLALFAVGVAATGWCLARRGRSLWQGDAELQDLFFLGLFVVPLVAVVALESVLYGGWRHLYFVYPAFLLVAMRGWYALWNVRPASSAARLALIAVTVIGLVPVFAWMVRAHPLQNIYFNPLAGSNLKARFDLDYWGLGNRLALEYILEHDPRPSIIVGVASETPLEGAFDMLAPADRQRLKYAAAGETADYIVDNFYGVRVMDDANIARDYEIFYDHRIDDETILSILKLKRPR